YALQSGGINTIVLTNAIIACFIYGLLYALAYRTGLLALDPGISPAESVAWSWLVVRQNLRGNIKKGMTLGIVIFLIVAIVAICISTLFYGIGYGLPYGMVFGSIVAFITGIVSILTSLLRGGWESSMITDKHQFIRPNEGIRHALFAAGVFGPIGGIV